MAALSLSSWAVHDWIGQNFEYQPGQPTPSGTLDPLLLLPAKAKALGFQALEVCDFHLLPDADQMRRFQTVAAELLHQSLEQTPLP